MQSDAEYKALASIIKNDRRQRLFIRLLVVVAFLTVLGFLQHLDNRIKSQINDVLASQTHLVIKSQKDSRIRSEENRRYVTCLLILPQEKRDVNSQKFCYDKSDLPGGRTESEFVPIEFDPNDETVAMLQSEAGAPGSVASSRSASSAQSAPVTAESQHDNSQTAAMQTTSNPQETKNPLTIPVVTPLLQSLKVNE